MMRETVQDSQEFSTAVDLLRPYVELGDRLPLHYTLPSGRSIEALCDRLNGAASSVSRDVEQTIRYLATKLAISTPDVINYHTYSLVLKQIALRLILPFEQRQAPLWSEGDRSHRDRLEPICCSPETKSYER